MNRTAKIMAVFFMCLALSSGNLRAEIIEIRITGKITGIDDRRGLLEGQLSAGDIITGRYTYDSSTPDSSALATVGIYQHSIVPYGVTLSAGGFIFQTDPDNVDFLLEVLNNHTGQDGYLLRSYNNLPLSNGVEVFHISWQLDDYSSTALSSDALPITPPVLEDWIDHPCELVITFGFKGASAICADVTSVELAPDIQAEIDIDPNTLNLQSKGKWLTCRIWLPEGYDVADIEPNSVQLENEPNAVDADWLWFDEQQQVAMAKFDRVEVQCILEVGQAELTVTGRLLDGTTFEGTDVIRVINKGRKK